MPNRWIRESARTSRNLNDVSDFSERLFWRLITTADDYGRFLACGYVVRSACFPLTDTITVAQVEEALNDLVAHKLIELYSIGDRQYGFFIKWIEHQGKPRCEKSKYPQPALQTSVSGCVQMQTDANRCLQMQTDAPGVPNTDTDTNTNLNSSSDFPDSESGKSTDDAEILARFEAEFWKPYPSRDGKKLFKSQALSRFIELSEEDQRLCCLAVKAYARHCRAASRTPVDPPRFFYGQRGEIWKEFIPPESKHAPIRRLPVVQIELPEERPDVPSAPPPPDVQALLDECSRRARTGGSTA